MKLLSHVIEEQQEYNWEWQFSFRDIPAGLAVNTPQVFPLGAGQAPGGAINLLFTQPQMRASDQIVQMKLHIITPFANTLDTAFNSDTMSVGDQGLATRFFSAVEGNLNGAFVVDSYFNPNTAYTYTVGVLPQYLQFTLNAMAGKSLSNLNQGFIKLFIQLDRAGAKERSLDLTKPPFI